MGKSRTGDDKPKPSTEENRSTGGLAGPKGLSISVQWVKFTDYVTVNGMLSNVMKLSTKATIDLEMFLSKEPLGNIVLLIQYGDHRTKIPYHNVQGYL